MVAVFPQKRYAEKQSVLILTVPEPAAVSSDKAAKNRVGLRCRAPRFLFPPVFSGKFSVPVFPCSFVKSQTTVEIVLSVEEPCSQILHISPTLHNSWYAAAGGNMHAWHHLNWRKPLPVRGRQCCWIPLHHKSVPQWWKSEKLPLVDWREILDKLPGNFFFHDIGQDWLGCDF